jgi:hypothetical protein
MAKLVLTNAVVKINSVDYSSNINQIELSATSDEIDTTSFSASGWRTVTGGLKSSSVTLSFHNDFAAGGVDSVLWNAFNTIATVVIIPNGTAVTSSNPSYQFTALVNNVSPVSASVGDLVVQNLTWPISGEIVRGTTA